MLPVLGQPPLAPRDVSLPDRSTAPFVSIGVVIVGHGSRDAQANAHFEELVERFRARHPDLDVSYGYVEIASPSLDQALVASASRNANVVAAPLFLFGAGHLKNDIPLALAAARSRYPQVVFAAARELGVHTSLVELAFERALPFLPGQHSTVKTAAIMVGRGASDPDANGEFCKLVRLFGEGRNFTWVMPSFIGITRPSFEDAAELVGRSRPDRVVVIPYVLFAGRLYEKLQDQVATYTQRNSWIRMDLASCLGADEKVLQVLGERVLEALEGREPLPCDTCQYRVPVSGVTENVGGLRALLWSMRHSFTHTQAAPHVHAHKPLTKHVLVCGNADCAERGSIALIASMRRAVRKGHRDLDIRVTRTGCMGRCGEGPTVAVYPDGIWYRGVQVEDASELVEEHLFHDRLVSRLVDSIMQ
jgi:sirohydrochlorin cobaltochelatase